MGVSVVSVEEHEQLKQEFREFKDYMLDYLGQVDDEIRGCAAAGKFIGVSRSTVARMIEDGRIPYSQNGKVISFSRKDLVAYKRSRKLGKAA